MGREISFSEAKDSSDGGRVENPPLEDDDGRVDALRDGDGDDGGGYKILEREDSETKAGSIMKDLDPWTAWFYKPHTVTVLIVGACLLVYILYPFAFDDGKTFVVVSQAFSALLWQKPRSIFLFYCRLLGFSEDLALS